MDAPDFASCDSKLFDLLLMKMPQSDAGYPPVTGHNQGSEPTLILSVQAPKETSERNPGGAKINLDKFPRGVKIYLITSSDVSTHLRPELKKLVGLDLR
jgi:hypothetical protein